jgi:hypothetical protein
MVFITDNPSGVYLALPADIRGTIRQPIEQRKSDYIY